MRLLIFLLLFPAIVRPSAIDSLDKLISTSTGIIKVELLANKYKIISDTLREHSQFDLSIDTLRHALSYAEQTNNVLLIAKCYNNLGLLYSKIGNFPESLSHYNISLEILREYGDVDILSSAFLNIGMTYKEMGVYKKSLQLLFEAEKLAKMLGKRTRLAKVYNSIGNVYLNLENYPKALTYYLHAIELKKKLNDQSALAYTYNNVGMAYRRLNNYDSALYFFKESLKGKIKEGKPDRVAGTYSNIGDVYLENGDINKAEEYFTKAYNLYVVNKLQEGILFSYIDFSNLAVKRRQYKEAEALMLKGVALARKIGIFDLEVDLYKMLKNLYKSSNKLPLAMKYYDLYIAGKDSLAGENKLSEISRLEIEYEADKKERTITLLNQQKQIQETTLRLQDEELRNQNTINLTLIIGSVILIALLGISYYAYLLKKKSSQQKETHMRELHHRVKNNLQVLSSLLSLQSEKLTDPTAREAVKDGETRVKAMALIHRRLYNEAEISNINMQEYISELVKYLADVYGYTSEKMVLSIDSVHIDIEQAIPIGLILNELVSNVFKYVFPGNPDALLEISFRKDTEGKLHLLVSDNGISQRTEISSDSFGIKLVQSLCKQLKAQLDVQHENGFRYSIII
jgi:two-component sensor histidine kinase